MFRLPQARCRWWRNVVPFLFFIQWFLILGIMFNYSILFVSLQKEFQSGSTLTGWLGSLSISVLCFLNPVSNLLHPRLSWRTMALAGMAVFCAALFGTSYVPSLGYAFATYGVLLAAGASLVASASMGMLVAWCVTGNYSRYAAIGFMGSTCGMLSFSYVLTAAIGSYGWRGALRVMSWVILGVGGLTGLLFAEAPPAADEQKDAATDKDAYQNQNVGTGAMALMEILPGDTEVGGDSEVQGTDADPGGVPGDHKDHVEVDANEGAQAAKPRGYLSMVKSFDPWLWTIGNLLAFLGVTFFNVNFASFLDDLHFDDNQIATSIVIFAVGEFCGKLLMAVVGDRLPFSYLYVMAGSTLLNTVTLGSLSIAKTFGAIAALAAVSGFLRAGVYSTSLVVSTELFHQTYGTHGSLTLFMFPVGIGTLLSGLLSGVLYDISGDYVLSLIVIAAIFLCGSVAMLAIPLRRRIRTRGTCSHKTPSVQS